MIRGATHRLLDVLGEAGVRATFFVQSKLAAAHTELPNVVVQEGHLLASHSHSHCGFPLLTAGGVLYELEESQRFWRGLDLRRTGFGFPEVRVPVMKR